MSWRRVLINLIYGYPNFRRTLEKRLRQFGTDISICFFSSA